MVSCNQLEQDNPTRPHIHCFAISLFLRLFRRHENNSATSLRDAVGHAAPVVGAEAEVNEFYRAEVSLLFEHYVLRFQVAMDYIARVDEFYSFQNPSHDLGALLFIEGLSPADALLTALDSLALEIVRHEREKPAFFGFLIWLGLFLRNGKRVCKVQERVASETLHG